MLSNIGNPSTKIGIKIEMTVTCLKAQSNEIIPKIKPKKVAPESPIKILEGNLLYFKYPKQIPTRIIAISADDISSLNSATINKVQEDIQVMPPANPSIPSVKFITVVTPNSQQIVKRNCSHVGSKT